MIYRHEDLWKLEDRRGRDQQILLSSFIDYSRFSTPGFFSLKSKLCCELCCLLDCQIVDLVASVLTILLNYKCRQSPSEFVIPVAKYQKAICNLQVSVGMRFRMVFETEESSVRRWASLPWQYSVILQAQSRISSTRMRCYGLFSDSGLHCRYMGTITGMGDLDPVCWPNSHWRSLKVLSVLGVAVNLSTLFVEMCLNCLSLHSGGSCRMEPWCFAVTAVFVFMA